MKQVWKIKFLGEVCEILDSKRKPITKKDRIEGEFPYYGATGILSYVHNYIFDERLILIGEDGAKWASGENTSFIAEGKYWVNNHAHVIRPNRQIVLDNWIVYFLNFSDLSKYVTGLTVPKLNQEKMRSISLPLPPLPEQQRIVSILDEAFAAIAKAKANAEQNLKNAKELFESYLQSVFENTGEGWEEETLGEVCEFMQGIQKDIKLQSEILKENQVRFLRIVDFTQGDELPRYIDNPGKKYLVSNDDISIVRYGASTGFVCRGLVGALANNLFRVIPKSNREITKDFLFTFLISSLFQKVIKRSMNGAAMPAISFGMIKDIPFPIIPLKAQQSIVRKLIALSSETKKLEAIYQQKINSLEELKKSILQKAFNGELKTSQPVPA